MKLLIALRGKANTGKSHTIKRVYELLKARYAGATSEGAVLRVDIKVILLVNGRKVGIESQGDPRSRLESSLHMFVKERCTVIICATRTRGRTVDAVEELATEYKLLWFEQPSLPGSRRESGNLLMARRILAAAEKALRG